MSERRCIVFFKVLLLAAIFFSSSFIKAQEPDLSDPVKVANDVLNFIRTADADGMLAIMDPDQKQAYLPFTPDKKQEMLRMIEKDKVKIGKVKKVSELRQCTTFSGKPGIAAKVRKKSGELFVITLSKQDNRYYYDNLLTTTPKAYKNLKLIQKVK